MVPNCIFLHLFHISRSTGFLKKNNNKRRRKRTKKHSIHKQNKGIKKNADLLVPPCDPFILPPISFLSSFWSLHRCYLFRENFLDTLCETAIVSLPFTLLSIAFHYINLLSLLLPTNVSAMGAGSLLFCSTLY